MAKFGDLFLETERSPFEKYEDIVDPEQKELFFTNFFVTFFSLFCLLKLQKKRDFRLWLIIGYFIIVILVVFVFLVIYFAAKERPIHS